MQKGTKRFVALTGLLIITGVFVQVLKGYQTSTKTTVDLTRIPREFAGWQGKEIPVDEEVNAILETEAVLMRQYQKGKDIVILAIVFYKDSRVALHLPESCLSGKGSKLVERKSEPILTSDGQAFSATEIITKSDIFKNYILYYFETKGKRTNSYHTLRWYMMRNNLQRKSSSGALIRFSTPFVEPYGEQAEKVVKEFMKEGVPLITAQLH